MFRRSSVIFAASLALLSTLDSATCFAAAAPAQPREDLERPRFLKKEIKRFVFTNTTTTSRGGVPGEASTSDLEALHDALTSSSSQDLGVDATFTSATPTITNTPSVTPSDNGQSSSSDVSLSLAEENDRDKAFLVQQPFTTTTPVSSAPQRSSSANDGEGAATQSSSIPGVDLNGATASSQSSPLSSASHSGRFNENGVVSETTHSSTVGQAGNGVTSSQLSSTSVSPSSAALQNSHESSQDALDKVHENSVSSASEISFFNAGGQSTSILGSQTPLSAGQQTDTQVQPDKTQGPDALQSSILSEGAGKSPVTTSVAGSPSLALAAGETIKSNPNDEADRLPGAVTTTSPAASSAGSSLGAVPGDTIKTSSKEIDEQSFSGGEATFGQSAANTKTDNEDSANTNTNVNGFTPTTLGGVAGAITTHAAQPASSPFAPQSVAVLATGTNPVSEASQVTAGPGDTQPTSSPGSGSGSTSQNGGLLEPSASIVLKPNPVHVNSQVEGSPTQTTLVDGKVVPNTAQSLEAATDTENPNSGVTEAASVLNPSLAVAASKLNAIPASIENPLASVSGNPPLIANPALTAAASVLGALPGSVQNPEHQVSQANSPVSASPVIVGGSSSPEGSPQKTEGATGSPVGVSASPGGISASPGGISASPSGISASPGGISASSVGVSASPGGVSAPPVGASASPVGVSASPGGVSASPGGISASPSASPVGVSASPGGVSASPVGASASPVGVSASPGGVSASPIGASASPVGASALSGVSASPGGVSASPVGASASPGVSASPGGISASPVGASALSGVSASPVGASALPGVSASPGGISASPVGASALPGVSALSGVSALPGGISASPVGASASPGGISASPVGGTAASLASGESNPQNTAPVSGVPEPGLISASNGQVIPGNPTFTPQSATPESGIAGYSTQSNGNLVPISAAAGTGSTVSNGHIVPIASGNQASAESPGPNETGAAAASNALQSAAAVAASNAVQSAAAVASSNAVQSAAAVAAGATQTNAAPGLTATPVVAPHQQFAGKGPYTQSPIGYDTSTTQLIPTSIIHGPSSTPSATSFGPTTLPSNVPQILYQNGGPGSQPPNTRLINIAFRYPLNYLFVYNHTISQQQIFHYIPLGICYGLEIEVSAITMQSLRAWNTYEDVGFITTLALAWIPEGLVDNLALLVSTSVSRFYRNPDNSTAFLLSMIDNAIPITGSNGTDGASTPFGNIPTDPSSAKNAGAPIGGDIGNSEHVRASSVGIGVGVACGAAAYGAAMFFVARRYKKRRQSHLRSPSMFSSPVMSHAGPDAGAGAALMSGAMGERSASPYYDNDGRAGSRGSGRSGSSRHQISAPVMAENSLGWN